MPFGLPVVPDEYDMAVPMVSSAIGVAGKRAVASSRLRIRSPSPGPFTTSTASTLGHLAIGGGGVARGSSRNNQNSGFAVVDDVSEFVCGQIRIDAGEVKSRALARAAAFDIAVVVLHEDGVVIEALEPAAAKKVREAVGALFQLGVRYGDAGLRHNERWLIGSNFGMYTWIHRMLLPDDCCAELFSVYCSGKRAVMA